MKDYPDRMTVEEARVFQAEVLNIVGQIPRGKVTTYGNVAALAGWPSHSRMVGRTLRYTPGAEKLPCHRVVNKEGVICNMLLPVFLQSKFPVLFLYGILPRSSSFVFFL